MSDVWRVTSDEGAATEREASSRHSLPVTRRAFTLVEMLVVISILGILAALVVPALKNIGKANANISASRQLLDAVGRARQLAIANHTTVYMVFVPTNYWGGMNLAQMAMPLTTNLADKQLTGYNFLAYGALGDQPGNHRWHYLDEWQFLPNSSFIAAQKFAGAYQIRDPISGTAFAISRFIYTNTIPFPTATNFNNAVWLPYIAFDYTGRLISDVDATGTFHDAYIPLAQGSVSIGIDPQTKAPQLTTVTAGDVTEVPSGNSTNISYNIVHIDWLTGRATLEYHKM